MSNFTKIPVRKLTHSELEKRCLKHGTHLTPIEASENPKYQLQILNIGFLSTKEFDYGINFQKKMDKAKF